MNANMKRSEAKARLLQDRDQLLKTVRDHEAGRFHHLGERDRDYFVASVKRRIVEVNEKIERLYDTA